MKAAIAAKWARALKSGKYNQTQDVLCDQNGHCCLGVLVELYHKEHGTSWNKKFEMVEGDKRAKVFKGHSMTVPEEVMKWSGLQDEEGSFIDEDDGGRKSELCLARLNDEEGKTFPELADIIMQRHEEL